MVPESAGEGLHGAGGSQGLPATASPVPAAHRGGCRRTSDLQRAPHADTVLWRREGEGAEPEGKGGRGAALAPLCDAAVSGGRRQTGSQPRETLAGTRGSGRAVRDGTAQSLSRHGGKEREGKQGSCLALARVSYSFPPTTPALLCQAGGPAVRARVRAGAAAGPWGEPPARARVPFPCWRSPDAVPPALLSLLPFPCDSATISYLKKINLFARQVRNDQQAVVYYVFIFLSSPPALYRLTVDLTFGISAHTQQLNGNKLSTFTSDKHYP